MKLKVSCHTMSMMKSIVILFMAVIASVNGVDRSKLESTPPPQKHFNEDMYMGDWYLVARMPSCSWSGSSSFTNCVSQYSKKAGGNVRIKGSWRSTDCAGATFDYIAKDRPGVYVLKDPIGDMLSGDNVVVATDYEKFAVDWGCTKSSVDGSCSDPYVGVKTRMKNPSPHTWKVIDAILNHYWELSLSEMIRVVHDENACVQF